jgi:hypothetical protein
MLLFPLPQVLGHGVKVVVVQLGKFLTHSPYFFNDRIL